MRLAVVAGIPSPWSEAAKGIFVVKGIDGMLVRFSAIDEAVKQWTGWHNAPVLFVGSDPPRTHWSEILAAAERLDDRAKLVPADPGERVRMFGLAHEILGEGGLVWAGRLVAIHHGLVTEGRVGFPLKIARYLAPKYGYKPEHVEPSRGVVLSALRSLGELAEASAARGHDYLLGDALTALDIYAATALTVFAPMPEVQCPGMHPAMRRAFETVAREGGVVVPAALLAHRDRTYERHLGLPVEI